MQNALAGTGHNAMNMAGMPNMGTGTAQGAADTIRLRKVWQEEYSSGETEMQFPDWLKAQGIKTPRT